MSTQSIHRIDGGDLVLMHLEGGGFGTTLAAIPTGNGGVGAVKFAVGPDQAIRLAMDLIECAQPSDEQIAALESYISQKRRMWDEKQARWMASR